MNVRRYVKPGVLVTMVLTVILCALVVSFLHLPLLADSASCTSGSCTCQCTGTNCTCSSGDGGCECSCGGGLTKKCGKTPKGEPDTDPSPA